MSAKMKERNWQMLEAELFEPLRGHELSDLESYVSSLLLSANSAHPISIVEIIIHVGLALDTRVDDRTVKELIRKLRRTHGFPVLSRRCKPSGYWWCQSASEMESFIETFRSQALDELGTVGKMVRLHYPELAGQLRLEVEGEQ